MLRKAPVVCLLLLAVIVPTSVATEARNACAIALESLGYKLGAYTFEEAGWVSKEKHIFNGTLVCYVNDKKEVHSIEDNGVEIVKDGFYGQSTLAKRDELNEARKAEIKAARKKFDEELKKTEKEINDRFDAQIREIKEKSEPAATADARKKRLEQITAEREAEKERVAKEEAAARETERKAEELSLRKRQSEIAKITNRTGSTVSLEIENPLERACADLLAGHIENIDVHFVKKESFFGLKYTVWYREQYGSYGPDHFDTRKCQISSDGTVKILSLFEDWE